METSGTVFDFVGKNAGICRKSARTSGEDRYFFSALAHPWYSGTFGRRLTFYEKRRGRRFNEDRGKIRWRGFRDSQNPWCALSVHWTSRGVIVVIVYRPTYSSYEPIRVPLSFCLVRHSLKGSLGEDINLLTGRRVLTKFLAGTVLPSIT